MRLTLDRNAMDSLLESMGEDVRLDFTKNVLQTALNKIGKGITESTLRKVIDENARTVLDEYIEEARTTTRKNLSQGIKDRIRYAVENQISDMKQELKESLREVYYKTKEELMERTSSMVKDVTNEQIQPMIERKVDEEVKRRVGYLLANLPSQETVYRE